jgi:uncharacterized membrane protein YeaQ/YmgE (transglycosylase-associated protein family)
MWDLIGSIVIGAVAGFVAKSIMKTGPSGFFLTACLGIAGSIAAQFIGQLAGWYKGGEVAGFIMSVIGAVVLLWVYGKFFVKK